MGFIKLYKRGMFVVSAFLLVGGVLFYRFYFSQQSPARPAPKIEGGAEAPASVEDFLRKQGEASFKRKLSLPLIAVYQKMLAQYPESIDLKKKLASAYLAAGKYDQARPLLEEVLKSSPADTEARNGLRLIQSLIAP